MRKIESFKPIINEKSKILILGSMPGKISLEKEEYYGNPRNHFWRIMYDLFGEPMVEKYEEKISFILKKRIALWDVIGKCEREGSLDANIKHIKPNDITGLLKVYPSIQAIFFNGGKAYETYGKNIGFQQQSIDYIKLPSTSPIPGRNIKTYEEKLESWRVLKSYLPVKALITDEHDDFASVVEGPEDVINDLHAYLLKFDQYEHPMCWGTEEFVEFLNNVVLVDRREEVRILELWTDQYDESLPKLRI